MRNQDGESGKCIYRKQNIKIIIEMLSHRILSNCIHFWHGYGYAAVIRAVGVCVADADTDA